MWPAIIQQSVLRDYAYRLVVGYFCVPEKSSGGNALRCKMDALLRSHHELRAAIRLAGQKIVQLNFGRRNDPVLELLRRTLRDARIVARAAQQQARQNLDQRV